MKNYLIILDGPEGSGKTTLSELLKNNLSNVEFFSLDNERKLIERTTSITNDNKKAFESIIKKLQKVFEQNKNAVIDSGISEERLQTLETLSNEHGVSFYKFSLMAPYEVLRSRVKARDKSRGREFDNDRFDVTFKARQAKPFDDFYIIDSSILSPQEMLSFVCSKLD